MAYRRGWTHKEKQLVCDQARHPDFEFDDVCWFYKITPSMLRRWMKQFPSPYEVREQARQATEETIINIANKYQLTIKGTNDISFVTPLLKSLVA